MRLARRTLLAGLGLGVGSQLALGRAPLAHAQSQRVPRLFTLFLPHGVPWEHFDPVGPSGELDFAANGIGGLSPLEPYREQVAVLRGVAMANDARDHGAIRAALTGVPDGGAFDSIDYIIARALGVTPHVLGAVPYREAEGFTRNSYLAKHGGAWVRALESPAQAAEQLFLSGPSNAATATDESAFEQEAFGLAEQQVARLAGSVRGLASEEAKLNVHLQALRDTRASSGPRPTSCTVRPPLPAVEALQGANPLDETQFGRVLDAQLEVAAQAMVCGAARVVTLQTMYANSALRFDFLDGPALPAEHHFGLSHVVEPRQPYAMAQRWVLERLATKLLSVLAQPDPLDPEHSVLDNSVIYVLSEVSDGSTHDSDSRTVTIVDKPVPIFLPQILIGGGAGYFKPGGRVVQVEANRPHTDVLATLAEAMGARQSELGGRAVSAIEELKA